MHISRLASLSVWLPFISIAAAELLQFDQHPIPWIENVVASVLTEFASYVDHKGPPPGFHPPPPHRPTHTPSPASYWLENIQHQGEAAFNPDPSYQVFRNVKDYGAKGDGVTDDTAAINAAISAGNRCAPGSCQSSTTTQAVVYFPAGIYLISSSIIDYYTTQIIGNPNSLPILKATPDFSGFGLIDGDTYGANGLDFGSTNIFYRQIRNFIFDLTDIPGNSSATGVHWPTAQATSLQNCVFKLNDGPGTQHQGIFIEEGSGGFMTDLVFYGGLYGVQFGNQQFTTRNLSFHNAVTAINQIWDWGWTYKNININNCSIGLNLSSIGATGETVGSVTFIDSSISNTETAFITAFNKTSQPPTAGSLILENVELKNVSVAIQGPAPAPVLQGTAGQTTIRAWGEGHAYNPNGPTFIEGPISPFPRPPSLLSGDAFYERSKPQYETIPASQFLSVRSAGAKGDGTTDDTHALNQVISLGAITGRPVFIDAGTYKVTGTIKIPANSKIVGEAYPVIMGSGKFFSDINHPQVIVQVGSPGERGEVELSDFIVSTQGATAGAILFEWNLASPSSSPSGVWDVHTRIGGFAGSNLQLADCPKQQTPVTVNKNCIAAYLTFHVTSSASGLYLENVWLWTADHDIDDPNLTQITIYAGRGLYIESGAGELWLYGTAVEHHTLYQYQLASTQNIFAGQIQTETAYYQPNPNALVPFPPNARLNDPNFAQFCAGKSGTCADGWGLRILDSQEILIYGAGLYSFFSNYSTACSAAGAGETCQTQIFGIDEGVGKEVTYSLGHGGGDKSSVFVYNLNTIGSISMVDLDGKSLANFADNVNVFRDTIALFHT